MDLLNAIYDSIPKPHTFLPSSRLLPFSLQDLLLSTLAATSLTIQNNHNHINNNQNVPPHQPAPTTLYPPPVATGLTSPRWSQAHHRAHLLISNLTLPELANLTHGHPAAGPCVGNTSPLKRLSLPALCFYDGPSGLRGQEFVSAFPAGIHLASTFDRDLMRRYGAALGSEFRGRGVNYALGPVGGPLGRVVRGGRNWEGFGVDPYLGGVGMGMVVEGMGGVGVVATVKHWLLNEQEYRRRWSEADGEAVSSNVDDRTLRELYVFPFMDALRAGAGGVMCSYQRANGTYACENGKLMAGILKGELGFEGFVVSDWDGQMSGVASANAGLDLVMPGAGYWGDKLVEAVQNGSVPEERLRDMAARILAPWFYAGQDNEYPPVSIFSNTERHADPVDVRADHASLIREIGAAGTVLVKNENGTLPLAKPKFVCVYGYDAVLKAAPWTNPDRYGGGYEVNWGWNTLNGTLITGGGSGSTTPPYVVSPFAAVQERVLRDGGILRWDFWAENPTPYVNADVCLVFINAYAGESFDRTSLTDEASDRLVGNVADWCARTVVVVHSAGIRVVDAWIDHPNITAVVFAGLPGQESGNSLVSVLYGDVNPSGRLPYTVARAESDYGALLNSTMTADDDFTEGLYIDYRAFDRDGITPRFPFGHGLSYTSFAYANLSVSAAETTIREFPDPDVQVIQGGHPQLWDVVVTVNFTITNTGDRNGTEVAQLYLGVPGAGEDTPIRQLRGFERVGPLAPGEAREVRFELTRRDLSVWDVVAQQWRVRRGAYRVWVGASSRDLRLDGGWEM
ncbi:putative beta-glucosidase M [Echria macrotheca]|uniref:Beta-glucosidase cel3A n=1 Tax=Echria macrotheca TaxID=438768 RepID=A0AAJ0B9N1_9PEZI|nr:putative beta-glucosidase M [Echria macrotheca]